MDPGADVRLCGYLRKQKSQHRRYCVLRRASESGPARLECFESEKRFRAGGPGSRPKRSFPLASALGISKRADGRHRHLVVLYGRDGTFGLAAEDGDQQQTWYSALLELRGQGPASPSGGLPRPAFREVWEVSLRPRGLGHSRNLAGAYLLCLAERTVDFVRLHSDAAAVVLQLLSVRRCGHSESFFFLEVGRSAATGPGELWMQVDDQAAAQHMHETILEAMKALSEDFRGKGQALASAPVSVPPLGSTPPAGQGALPRRPRPDGTPGLGRSPAPQGQEAAGPRKAGSLSDHSAVSSDEGGSSPGDSRPPGTPDPLAYLDYISMGRLASPEEPCLAAWAWGPEPNKRASLPPLALGREPSGLPPGGTAPRALASSASYPEGLHLRSSSLGYMAMLPGGGPSPGDQDYVPMTPGSVSPPQERGGYMLMSPSGSCSPERPGLWGAGRGEGSSYVHMSPASRSASSTPPEPCPLLAAPSSSTAFYSLARPGRQAPRPPPCPCGRTGRLSHSSSTSSESLGEPAGTPECHPPGLFVALPGGALEEPGEYVGIGHCPRLADYVAVGRGAAAVERPGSPAQLAAGARLARAESLERRRPGPEASSSDAGLLNYMDLDLGRGAAPTEAAAAPRSAADPGQAVAPNTYASIDFHRSGGLSG